MTPEKEEFLAKYIPSGNYTVRDDGTIDAHNVEIRGYERDELPVEFNHVDTFSVIHSEIKTLKGCPKSCGQIWVNENMKLTSIKYAPTVIDRFISVSIGNLSSLDWEPDSKTKFYLYNFNKYKIYRPELIKDIDSLTQKDKIKWLSNCGAQYNRYKLRAERLMNEKVMREMKKMLNS